MRVCRGSEVVGAHRTKRFDDLASVNEILPVIAANWHKPRDGMTAVSNLYRFSGGYFFEILARVLPQLAHPYRLHVLHCST